MSKSATISPLMTVKLAIDRNLVLTTEKHQGRSTAQTIWPASKSIDLDKEVNQYEHDDHSIKKAKFARLLFSHHILIFTVI